MTIKYSWKSAWLTHLLIMFKTHNILKLENNNITQINCFNNIKAVKLSISHVGKRQFNKGKCMLLIGTVYKNYKEIQQPYSFGA